MPLDAVSRRIAVRAFLARSARSAGCGLGLIALGGAAQAAWQCTDLVVVTTEDATITSAAVVPPGPVAGANVNADVGFCRVQGVARPSADSEIKFEVWLPETAAAWTGRLKVNGTGGYAGAVPFTRLAQDIGDGFVTAGSNMGHDGGENASWTLGRPEKVKDWGLRAHYSVTTAAKAVSAALYGRPVQHAYFEGCSNGGRQALMMAQNYPQLFDGIVAGAPSNFYPDLLMWLLWTGKQLTPSAPFGPPAVSEAKRQAVTARVLAACDAQDGLADGQLTSPRACNFDIETLGPAGDGTLSAQELAVFQAMYEGTTSETGERKYTGAKLGSEADWSPLFADNGGYGNFIGHYVYGVPTFDWRNAPGLFSTVYADAKAALTPVTAAPSPDLRAFRAHGGKLIQVHGWNDSVVAPDGSIGYFHALTQFEKIERLPTRLQDAVIDRLSPLDLAVTSLVLGDRVRQFHRLFMMPAVGHCGGSTGPSAIGGGMPEPPKALRKPETHVVSALMKWVEQGVAPEKIVATRLDANGNILRQRPLCPYPEQAVYIGKGSVDRADSFACRLPLPARRSQRPDEWTGPFDVNDGDLLHARNALTQRKLLLPDR
ncbi:tannase/feruloyl esterase family alpha/beta hydrolase [Variovorax sp.]|uniref:tannase/feruloyl esterase family alpha/beta hydrolase n=1 Tax=Variovorax sp. TaxID=1871043 RepID=UPI002D58AF36|nr:tannase/feruloyl esterase family alpha/beta hydrolase [Variovorax sp.]HYP84417.1 tannase/feruloyl esterase family alpha/beta hydrolase [Variovorax sp.]